MNRPYPSKNLGEYKDGYQLMIEPAHDINLFVKKTFLMPGKELFNVDHYHLDEAIDNEIAFLWAATGFEKQFKYILGQTEQLAFRVGGFQRMRQEQQFYEWFGYIPSFIITLNGSYCRDCSDVEFCALLEHEIYHCGQVRNGFGEPKFSKDTGLPVLGIVGHDVEEFVGVVRRYGISENSKIKELVDVANNKPEIAKINISQACGTCLLRKAA